MALYFVFKKHLYSAGLIYREAIAKYFSKLLEQFKYIKLIKFNSIQEEVMKRVDNSFASLNDSAINNQKITYFYSSADGIISMLAQITLFVIGGLQMLAGNFSIGMFTIFTSYFAMMLSACRYFFSLGSAYQSAMVACNRIHEILRQNLESQGKKQLLNIDVIELQKLSFSYIMSNEMNAITRMSAIFSKGNIYAITGANGAGKSTLINLLLGMYIDEYDGHIIFNGVDIRNLNMVAVRRDLIGFAEQEPQLINDTILYNLTFGNPQYSDFSFYINLLKLNNFISEHGLEYILNEKNTNTSGGEKQKIAILKVLHKNPDIMIFDEPSSALEKDTVESFIAYLQHIKHSKIIIIVTHDDAIKSQCDKIINM